MGRNFSSPNVSGGRSALGSRNGGGLPGRPMVCGNPPLARHELAAAIRSQAITAKLLQDAAMLMRLRALATSAALGSPTFGPPWRRKRLST